jgi:Domain of unknown function (DUF4372)
MPVSATVSNGGKPHPARLADDFMPNFTHTLSRRPRIIYTPADLFRVMAFAQLTWRESLRDIAVCLAANHAKFYFTWD